jgi:hypothetical protein
MDSISIMEAHLKGLDVPGSVIRRIKVDTPVEPPIQNESEAFPTPKPTPLASRFSGFFRMFSNSQVQEEGEEGEHEESRFTFSDHMRTVPLPGHDTNVDPAPLATGIAASEAPHSSDDQHPTVPSARSILKAEISDTGETTLPSPPLSIELNLPDQPSSSTPQGEHDVIDGQDERPSLSTPVSPAVAPPLIKISGPDTPTAPHQSSGDDGTKGVGEGEYSASFRLFAHSFYYRQPVESAPCRT